MVDGSPNPIDVYVGNRLRKRRTFLGLSQETLGASVGLTFQQVQKYERGTNRIGASRLFHLSQILDVDQNYFFEDIPVDLAQQAGIPMEHMQGLSEEMQAKLEPDPMAQKETMDLIRAYYAIDDAATRRKMLELVKTMAQSGNKSR